MISLRHFYTFCRNLFRRKRMDQELDDEICSYVDLLAEEKIKDGAYPEEARRAARIETGGMEQVKEQVRQIRPGFWLDTLLQDLRYGARMLRKSPGVTLVTALTLALGMGANTAMFSSIDALLLHPLDFPDPDRLVALAETQPRSGFEPENVAPADFLDWKKTSSILERLAAYRESDFDLTGTDEPDHIHGARVSVDFFATLGVGTTLGRTFIREEEQPGHEQVAVISYGLWQQHFLGDRRALNTEIELNGMRFKVIGVMDAEFNFPLSTQVWTPLPVSNEFTEEREKQSLFAVARLAPAATVSKAQAEMNTIAARLERLHPKTNTGRRVSVSLLRERAAGDFTPIFLWIGLGSVLFVLSIACVNVANMQLARAAVRGREMAVRAAIGASRKRIIRQLLTENVVLALMGGTLGLAVAAVVLRLLKRGMPPDLTRIIPGWQSMTIDARTLAFTFTIALLTGIVFGMVPALAASKPELTEALKEGEKSSILGGGRHRMRNVLVISEVALALVLLVGTGLMVKGFRRLAENQRQGYSPENVLTMGVTLASVRYPQDYKIANFYQGSIEGIRELPGVASACAMTYVPSSGAWTTEKFLIEGRPAPALNELQTTNLQIVTPGCFETLRIPLLQGRDFTAGDRAESQKVAIISAEFARRYLAGNPLGERIRIGSVDDWVTVVGVVGDVRRFMFDRAMRPMVYFSNLQSPARTMHLVVRAQGDPGKLTTSIRAQLLTVDRQQPVFDVKTIETIIDEQISGVRIGAGSMIFYGLLALLLSAMGVYGVVTHSVQQRRHEIGIRMAVGAQARDILQMVLGQTIQVTVTGLAFGLIAAFAVGRIMARTMFGMIALDPATFLIITAVLTAVALLASYIPARKAAQVDPIITLRCE